MKENKSKRCVLVRKGKKELKIKLYIFENRLFYIPTESVVENPAFINNEIEYCLIEKLFRKKQPVVFILNGLYGVADSKTGEVIIPAENTDIDICEVDSKYYMAVKNNGIIKFIDYEHRQEVKLLDFEQSRKNNEISEFLKEINGFEYKHKEAKEALEKHWNKEISFTELMEYAKKYSAVHFDSTDEECLFFENIKREKPYGLFDLEGHLRFVHNDANNVSFEKLYIGSCKTNITLINNRDLECIGVITNSKENPVVKIDHGVIIYKGVCILKYGRKYGVMLESGELLKDIALTKKGAIEFIDNMLRSEEKKDIENNIETAVL